MASGRRQVAAEVSGESGGIRGYISCIALIADRVFLIFPFFIGQVGHRGGQRVDVEERAENSRGQLFLPREEFPRFR